MIDMKWCWQKDKNVFCLGKIFKDGWGMIFWLEHMREPIIWKVGKRNEV